MIMHDMKQFEDILWRYWKEAIGEELPLPSEARFVTGVPKNDSFLHHMLVEHGVDIELTRQERQTAYDPAWKMTDYKVVDDKKYNWFVLRWI